MNPLSLERKRKVEGDRAWPPAAMRRPRRPPPRGDGLSPTRVVPVPGPDPGCGDGGLSDRGYPRPGVSELRGLLGRGILRGMSGGRRWRGRNQTQLRRLVTDVYGWRCSICHTMINPDATRLRDRLSIDHVLPVSRGGTDAIENLRPAHYGCNAARGDGSRTVRRRPTEIGTAFFPTGPGREPAPTFRFPPNRLKFGKNGETE